MFLTDGDIKADKLLQNSRFDYNKTAWWIRVNLSNTLVVLYMLKQTKYFKLLCLITKTAWWIGICLSTTVYRFCTCFYWGDSKANKLLQIILCLITTKQIDGKALVSRLLCWFLYMFFFTEGDIKTNLLQVCHPLSNLGRDKRKNVFEHAKNAHSVLPAMRKVSSRPWLSILTFFGCVVSAYAWRQFSHGATQYVVWS